jgi:hypothetical protein
MVLNQVEENPSGSNPVAFRPILTIVSSIYLLWDESNEIPKEFTCDL